MRQLRPRPRPELRRYPGPVPEAPQIITERLLLRHWNPDDRDRFAALNADPDVMAYFPAPLSRPESDALLDRIEDHCRLHGYGFWALQHRDTGELLGLTGLAAVNFPAPFTPAVEIGWRLARSAWGHGYATEAARAALAHGFTTLGLTQIVAFTAATNLRSQAVMQRLHMTHDPRDDFDHPLLPAAHRLRRHVLHRARPTGANPASP
jgi:ribosomal-protein-alanine N-acetyltransferase